MDEQRFDNVTRAVAAAMPRRSALAAIGGGFAALATLGRALAQDDDATPTADEAADGASVDPFASARCKNDGKKCKKNKDCCSGKCKNKACKSSGGGSGKCKYGITYAKQWGGWGADNQNFKNPRYVTTDTNDHVFVTDSGNWRVLVTDVNGKYQTQWGVQWSQGNSMNNDKFSFPTGIAAAKNSNDKWIVYVADKALSCVKRFNIDSNGNGIWKATWGSGNSSVQLSLNNPYGVAVGKSGTVYIADSGNNRIRVVDSDGDLDFDIYNGNGPLNGPRGVAVIDNNDASFIVVADTNNHRIVQFDLYGEYIKAFGTQGSGTSQFSSPGDVSVDKCGNVWVADTDNNRVVVLDKNLKWNSSYSNPGRFPAGSGEGSGLSSPTSVNVDKNSHLFVVDSGNNRVFREDIS